MKLLRYDQTDFAEAIANACAASSLLDPKIEEAVRAVIVDVRARGDAALVELTQRFDQVMLTAEQLRVTGPTPKVDPELQRAIAAAHKNITAFAKRSVRKNWRMRNAQAGIVGEKFDPLQRVGIYIPGGTAPLVSTVLMTTTLAKVAGCPEIVVCTPPGRNLEGEAPAEPAGRRFAGRLTLPNSGFINPALLYAAKVAGATEIYQVGGAQAIAAMAVGTPTIRRVVKIFGPGNAYVTAAKRLLFGVVGIDMLSGPSELLVLADDRAEPRYVAADMLAQAEHGSGYERVWLVTTSERVFAQMPGEIRSQTAALPRADLVRRALENNGVLVLAKDLPQAIRITNQFAPEHCELMTRNNARVLRQLTTPGAVFLGPWTPTVVGDYLAGPSHALPTGGAGAWFAGLTVDQFQRRTSVIELSRAALKKSLPALEALGEAEGLDAHVRSARVRFK
ncbi:MAG TPA: histidinol dehydrogenase [Verrucomicrobiae bacterium]|nr:histidinol dehydrogenase [Verrucomicrobiae bacterium]